MKPVKKRILQGPILSIMHKNTFPQLLLILAFGFVASLRGAEVISFNANTISSNVTLSSDTNFNESTET